MIYGQRSTRLIWRLVEESHSEASFLRTRFDAALDSPDHSLAETRTWVEGRLLGMLDGVRIAGSHAIAPLLTPALHAEDASPQARATVLEALTFCGESPDPDRPLLLADDEPSLRRAAATTLRFVPDRVLDELADHAFVSPDLEVRNKAVIGGVATRNARCWHRCVALASSPDARPGPLLALATSVQRMQRDRLSEVTEAVLRNTSRTRSHASLPAA
ncbi:MAG: hypothetical protein JWN04_336 [Myxococcaceae bacterium]|nr:hypothetical protein [Myxococcaceae bacterium]